MANNRTNSDFQILYFIVGAKHTVDGAYSALLDLEEDRAHALDHAKAGAIKHIAAEKRARLKLLSDDECERLDAEAELFELEADGRLAAKNVIAAEQELAFIRECKARLEPHRKYAGYELHEAIQLAQRDEWCLELMRRAENFLLTGGIPADQFGAMRLHPDFSTRILPHIEKIKSGGKPALEDNAVTQLMLGASTCDTHS